VENFEMKSSFTFKYCCILAVHKPRIEYAMLFYISLYRDHPITPILLCQTGKKFGMNTGFRIEHTILEKLEEKRFTAGHV